MLCLETIKRSFSREYGLDKLAKELLEPSDQESSSDEDLVAETL